MVDMMIGHDAKRQRQTRYICTWPEESRCLTIPSRRQTPGRYCLGPGSVATMDALTAFRILCSWRDCYSVAGDGRVEPGQFLRVLFPGKAWFVGWCLSLASFVTAPAVLRKMDLLRPLPVFPGGSAVSSPFVFILSSN
jgi:hypothetical protein